MHLKFKSMIGMIKKKDIDHVQNGSLLKGFFGGDTESLQMMTEEFDRSSND